MRALRRQTVYWVVLGFFVGCFVMTLVAFSWWQPLVILGGAVGIVILVFGGILHKKSRGYIFVFIGLMILGFMLGVMRVGVMSDDQTGMLDEYVDQQVEIIGTTVTDRDMRQTNQKLTVNVEQIILEGIAEKVDINVLVTARRYPEFLYGDEIRITGQLVQPENFVSDTGREFDYVNYLAVDDIYYQMFYPEIEVISRSNGVFIKRTMLRLKHLINNAINRMLPQPSAGLLSGELLGEKAALGGELQEDFRRTGVIHVVVLSGFNVTIVAIFVVWLLSRVLHPRIALFAGIGGIALFALLVGGGATVIRASIMAVLAIIGRLFGREYDILRALFIAGFVMVMINPAIVVYDISFQLSFLATMSLIAFAPHIESRLRWVPEQFTLREAVVATLSAQVLVIPLLMYSIGELSLISPIANLFVIPLVPLTMLFGFIMSLVALLSPALALIPAFPTYVLLKAQLFFVDIFSSLSFTSIPVPPIPWWVVAIFYVLAFVWVIRTASQAEDKILAKYVSGSSMEDKLKNL